MRKQVLRLKIISIGILLGICMYFVFFSSDTNVSNMIMEDRYTIVDTTIRKYKEDKNSMVIKHQINIDIVNDIFNKNKSNKKMVGKIDKDNYIIKNKFLDISFANPWAFIKDAKAFYSYYIGYDKENKLKVLLVYNKQEVLDENNKFKDGITYIDYEGQIKRY